MKRCFIIALMVMIFAIQSLAYAEAPGVQVISPNNSDMDVLSLDDIKLGEMYSISGYAKFRPLSFEFINSYPYYVKGSAGDNSYSFEWNGYNGLKYNDDGSKRYKSIMESSSGTDADYAWLLVDLTNLQKEEVAFIKQAEVKVVYDDEYEFAGFVRQFNRNYSTSREYKGIFGTSILATLNPDDEQPIGMMYTGLFTFACTLPNEVINGTEPLRMEIKLGDNELIYNIRK